MKPMKSGIVASFDPNTPPVVVFVHVPKTGGTTIYRYLKRYFRKNARISDPDQLQERFLDKPANQRNALDFISGHVPTGVIHRATSRPCIYFTCFRDPLPKAISNYSHVLRWSGHRWHRRFIEKKITLEKFLIQHDDVKDFLIDNPSVRLFSDPLRTHDPQPMTSDLVEQVKTRLREQFAFIGLTERNVDSVFLLSRKLKLPLRPYLTHNVTRRPEGSLSSLSREVIARFKELNWADYEIYGYAERTFEGQWGELDAREKKRAGRFRRVQRFLTPLSHKAPYIVET